MEKQAVIVTLGGNSTVQGAVRRQMKGLISGETLAFSSSRCSETKWEDTESLQSEQGDKRCLPHNW